MCIELIFLCFPVGRFTLFVLHVDGRLKTAAIPGKLYNFGCWQAIGIPFPQFEVFRDKTGFCNKKSYRGWSFGCELPLTFGCIKKQSQFTTGQNYRKPFCFLRVGDVLYDIDPFIDPPVYIADALQVVADGFPAELFFAF